MKVNTNHRLVNDDNRQVRFIGAANGGSPLAGGVPKFLIIHYTAGATADGAIAWFRNPTARASAHLVVDHDGAITQMMPFDKVAWHAGASSWKGIDGLNRHSVGIEIVNWGLLRGKAGSWGSWTGTPVPDSRVVVRRHKNFDTTILHGWEIFDEAQIEQAVAAAAAIVVKYGIPEANVLGHDDISPQRKQDPGPAFDMVAFRARVFGHPENPPSLSSRRPGSTFVSDQASTSP